ncbi:hypothetical protein BDV59DRAFT_178684 [Aspergillus ambiguus]|uniref:uncharacterized protein n=1 Tax=Aspergillus ambiguus TaxID=176160 RepID=UPI003CCDE03F
MGDLFARLIPVSSSFSAQSQQMAIPSSRIFSLRSSSRDQNATALHLAGYPDMTLPVFSITVHNTSKPNLLLFRGAPNASSPIGSARFHSLSSTTDVTLRGEPIRMKTSALSGSFTIETPRQGSFKWHLNQLTGTALELDDCEGRKIASLKYNSFGFGEKKLEIMVPCKEEFVEFIVMTGMVAKVLTGRMTEGSAEAAGGIFSTVVGV